MFTMRNKTLYSKLPVYGGKFTIKYKVNLPEIIDHGGSLLNTTPAVCMGLSQYIPFVLCLVIG